MTTKETLALLCLAKTLYPRDKCLDKPKEELSSMAKAWSEMLQDIPFDLGKAAVAAHAASSPYAPAISEIRAYARRMTEPEQLTAEEAWSLAIRAIRRYGTGYGKIYPAGKFHWELARDSVPPEVWRVMDLLGYQSMCRSNNEDVLRGQFIRAWERQQQRQAERANLLPFLPPALRDRFLALGSEPTGQLNLPGGKGNSASPS